MRHKKKGRKLGLTASHYKAMSRHMTNNLFKSERIITTIKRAKEFRPIAENLITRSKTFNLANYRYVLSHLQNINITKKLFNDIAPRFKNINGGYTRIIRLGGSRWSGDKKTAKWASRRLGDAGDRVILELVVRTEPTKEKAKKGKEKNKEVKKK